MAHTPTLAITHRPADADRPDGSFETSVDGHRCMVDYRRLGDGRVLFHHTEVAPALQGCGIAAALVQAGLDWARAQGLKVVPSCSYVSAYIRRHPAEQDLLG